MALPVALALLVAPLCVSSGPTSSLRLQQGNYARRQYSGVIYGKRWRCPRQTSCYPPTSYYNPCCFRPPPIDPTPPPTWIPPPPTTPPPTTLPPTMPPTKPPPICPLLTTPTPTTPSPTEPPPICPFLTTPPPPPPTIPPTEPPMPPPTLPPTPCDMYGQCGCSQPVTPPVCPFAAAAAGSRIRRRVQRKCYLNGHCPEGFSCCTNGCRGTKVCTPTTSTSTSSAADPHKVNVSVVITSASRASHWFLTTHLHPFLRDLRDNINLELIPYGKVTKEGQCQFGLGDCLGNWLVSCAGEHLPDQDAQLAFATCLMAKPGLLESYNFTSITSTAIKCGQSFPSKINELYRCGVGLEGYHLFQEAGLRQEQLTLSLTEVPTVALDGVVVIGRNEDISRFPALVCAKLRNVPQARALCQRALSNRQ